MKFAALLLAILVLTLNCIPCADAAAMDHAPHARIESHNPHANDADEHADNCSPLCTCSCCAVASIPATFIAIETVTEIPTAIQASAYTGNLLTIVLPIWQPPQLQA